MSCTYSEVRGIGIETSKITNETLREFFKNHKETINNLVKKEYIAKSEVKSLFENIQNNENLIENLSDWESYCGWSEGIKGLVCDIMSEETGINFEYYESQDEPRNAIILNFGLPWMFNEKEKMLSHNEMNKILKEYADELKVSYDDFNMISFVYFG